MLYDFRFGLVLGGLFLTLGGFALRAGLSGSSWAELAFDRQRGRPKLPAGAAGSRSHERYST